MPKMKTNKAAAKRFKRTASGKIKREMAGAGHLFSSKSPARKRKLRAAGMVNSRDKHGILKLIPYK